MKDIPDKSIDMILCDLPYGTTACKWDTIIPFEPLWEQYKRIIKIDGVVVLTASQPFTSALVMSNPNWFSYSWVWEKEQGVNFLMANKMPLKVHEDIVVFQRPDSYDINAFQELKYIFSDIMLKIGKNKKKIVEDLGQGLDHCFRFDSLQWGLPTEKNYLAMKEKYNLQNIPEYIDLKKMYQLEFKGRDKTYHPQKTVGKKYISGLGNSGDVTGNVAKTQTVNEGTRNPKSIIQFKRETGLHPTQKPVALFEYLIKTYTNEGDLVLDNCAGSGTTGVACKNLNRNYILIEKEPEYIEIIKKRLAEVNKLLK
jgi:adenine specific DNA methylase Mod